MNEMKWNSNGQQCNIEASKVWRYQRDNHKTYIKGQIIQWPNEKRQKDKRFMKYYTENYRLSNSNSLKTGVNSGRVRSCCSTCGSRLRRASRSEWMSDCYLIANSNFSAISWREQVNFQWDDGDGIRLIID
jgi:hypothetical protein